MTGVSAGLQILQARPCSHEPCKQIGLLTFQRMAPGILAMLVNKGSELIIQATCRVSVFDGVRHIASSVLFARDISFFGSHQG